MNKWVKQIMKTPGPIKVQLSLLTILATSSVTSTSLQIMKTVDNTSDVNIFGSSELLKVKREK